LNTVFNPSYKITENDLNVLVVDNDDMPVDPYKITYSIYKVSGRSSQELITNLDLIPVKKELGIYYPGGYQVPGNSLGRYAIKWNIQLTVDCPSKVLVQEFTVIRYELGE